jgi:hypothetical protein
MNLFDRGMVWRELDTMKKEMALARSDGHLDARRLRLVTSIAIAVPWKIEGRSSPSSALRRA